MDRIYVSVCSYASESLCLWYVCLSILVTTINVFGPGIPYDELSDDPNLVSRRDLLITAAAKKLSEAKMINFNQSTRVFTITDLGRIAAKYYIRHSSIEVFNREFRSVMTEADVLGMLSMSTEVRYSLNSVRPTPYSLTLYQNSLIRFKFESRSWKSSRFCWKRLCHVK